jgi:hypothetical protein
VQPLPCLTVGPPPPAVGPPGGWVTPADSLVRTRLQTACWRVLKNKLTVGPCGLTVGLLGMGDDKWDRQAADDRWSAIIGRSLCCTTQDGGWIARAYPRAALAQ